MSFDMLAALGFPRAEIDAANTYVCGALTVEGAPHLPLQPVPVFDCPHACVRTDARDPRQGAHTRTPPAASPHGGVWGKRAAGRVVIGAPRILQNTTRAKQAEKGKTR